MRIKKEEELLDIGVRHRIIEEINGPENIARKKEALKRYEILKDKTNKYVEDLLLKQFDPSTVEEMKYSIANLSMFKKVINKKARVYSNGVIRELAKKRDQKLLDLLVKELNFNSKMKKTDRFLETFKNTMVYVRPNECKDGTYEIKLSVLAPFLYDVVERYNEKEEPLCVILSNFSNEEAGLHSLSPAQEGRSFNTPGINNSSSGDGVDQTIADQPGDGPQKEFIWWTDSYHFTTNEKGEIIAGPDNIENPIEVLPFVNFAKDQDDSFWALGGDDLVDGAILINSMISNTNHIGIVQGYGQPYMTGSNLPQRQKVGPNFLVKLEHKDGEPVPTFGFANANPPLSELKEMIVMYVALLLSTNNLSTSGVKVDLNSGADFASGIALMIDKSESIEDVQDQAGLFQDNEIEIFKIYMKWAELYKSMGLLSEDLKDKVFDVEGMTLKVVEPKPIITEREKLESFQMRKDLGINSMIDIIRMDNPEMNDEQALEKLLEIQKEKLENMATFGVGPDGKTPVEADPNKLEEEDPKLKDEKANGNKGFGSKGLKKGDQLDS